MTQPLIYPHTIPPALGQMQAVAPGVYWIKVPLPWVLDHVNVYALEDADGWTLIDTGLDTPDTRALWQALLQGPLAQKPVQRVIVTHHHPDHVGLAGWFQAQGAELWMPRTGWLMARMMVLDDQPLPLPQTLDFWHAAGMDAAQLAAKAQQRPTNYSDMVYPLPLGYRRLQQGDVLDLAGRRWQVHMGHGHAPEHATLWSEDGAIVIGGDQLLPSISPNLGVYATEPEADPVGEWLESCRRLKHLATQTQLVLPGHKLPFSGLLTRLDQLEANHFETLERLYDHLVQPQTAVACFPALFRRKIGASNYGLALVEAVAHLNHLYQAGRITRQRDTRGVWQWQQSPQPVATADLSARKSDDWPRDSAI